MSEDPPACCLYTGEVYHGRHMPFRHHFRYRVFGLWADLDRLDDLGQRLKLFSYNRFNVLSFRDRDHGPRDGSPLRPWIEDAARARGLDIGGGRIDILTFPRLWGYAFNPITLFACRKRTGELAAILYQVKNTFGEQHGYMLEALPDAHGTVRQSCRKVFHVSPFIGMDCRYHFTFRLPDERLAFSIRQETPDGKILTASWKGVRKPLTDSGIAAEILRNPVMTWKVIAGIHWEALQLWRKGARYIRKPALPSEDISG